jgi:hypothetical protein
MSERIKNILESSKEVINALLNEKGRPDFNEIIPFNGYIHNSVNYDDLDVAKYLCGDRSEAFVNSFDNNCVCTGQKILSNN